MVATGGRQRWLEVVFHNSLLFVVDCCIEQITSGILVLKTIEIIFKNYEISWNLKRFWLTGNMKSELPDMHTAWKVSKYGVISGPHFSVFSPNAGKYEPEITPYLNTFHAVAGRISSFGVAHEETYIQNFYTELTWNGGKMFVKHILRISFSMRLWKICLGTYASNSYAFKSEAFI